MVDSVQDAAFPDSAHGWNFRYGYLREKSTRATRQDVSALAGGAGERAAERGRGHGGRRGIGLEGPTVRNRTVAYFLHYPGAGFRAAVEHSKVRSRNQHDDWKGGFKFRSEHPPHFVP
jgi:hypothetical protein